MWTATTLLLSQLAKARKVSCLILSEESGNVLLRISDEWTIGNDRVSLRLSRIQNRGGTISIDVDGKDATGPVQIATTNDPTDPLAWRQWHHWNLAAQLFNLHLDKGKKVLTVHILTLGNMNLAYFDFKPIHQ